MIEHFSDIQIQNQGGDAGKFDLLFRMFVMSFGGGRGIALNRHRE